MTWPNGEFGCVSAVAAGVWRRRLRTGQQRAVNERARRAVTGAPGYYGPANPRHQYEELSQQYAATYGRPPLPPHGGPPTSPSAYYSGKPGPPPPPIR